MSTVLYIKIFQQKGLISRNKTKKRRQGTTYYHLSLLFCSESMVSSLYFGRDDRGILSSNMLVLRQIWIVAHIWNAAYAINAYHT